MLIRALKSTNTRIKTLSSKTSIRPILKYGAIVRSPYQVKQKSKLEKIQRKALDVTVD